MSDNDPWAICSQATEFGKAALVSPWRASPPPIEATGVWVHPQRKEPHGAQDGRQEVCRLQFVVITMGKGASPAAALANPEHGCPGGGNIP